MEKQFVTYDIALKLKLLGFAEECLAFYTPDSKELLPVYQEPLKGYFTRASSNESIHAPLWQQVIDWFRDTHRFHIEVFPIPYANNSKIAYFYHIDSDDMENPIYDYQDKYSEILDASEQDIPGNHLNKELYDKNLFDMDFAYIEHKEALEKAILKAIEILWKNN